MSNESGSYTFGQQVDQKLRKLKDCKEGLQWSFNSLTGLTFDDADLASLRDHINNCMKQDLEVVFH